MIDREELLRKYAGGEKDFTGQSFVGADFRSKIFRGGIYTRADFSEALLNVNYLDRMTTITLSEELRNLYRTYALTENGLYSLP